MLKKISIVVLLAALVVALTSYGIYKIFYPGEQNSNKKPKSIEEEKFVAVGRTNIAVIGVDQRDEDNGRADTIFVIMYEPKTKKVSMLSVPRDTRVRITDTRWDKINHSYNYGGSKTVVNVLEQFLGIHIDYYIQLDFQGFERMVDAIDGVDIDVESRMYYEDPWDGENGFIIDLQKGQQKLDGKKAIQYVRYRDEDGDIGRVRRQQLFIDAIYKKMLAPEMLKSFPELAKVAYDSVETNMSIVEIVSVGRTMHENTKDGINSFSVPGTPAYIEHINYWLPDVYAVRTEVAQILGLTENEKDRFLNSAVRVANSYENSLPADVHYGEDVEDEEPEEEADKDKDKDKDGDEDGDKPSDKDIIDKSKKSDTTPDKKDKNEKGKVSDKNTKDNKKEQKPDIQSKAPRQVRAIIVNCSGNKEGGHKMERLLEQNGVSVIAVSDGQEQPNSAIVSNTQDGWVVSRLAALPFRYSLRINKGDTSVSEAVVYVGKDFVQKN